MSKSKGEQWAQAEAWHHLWPVLQELGVDEKCPDMSGCEAAITFVRGLARERDTLRSALAGIRVTAREQCQKTGAPVAHALDFILALDRILNDAAEALDGGATT